MMNLHPRVGHTHTAIHGVINNPEAVLIVLDSNHEGMLEKEYPELKGRVKTWDDWKFKGSRKPIVFDSRWVEKLSDTARRMKPYLNHKYGCDTSIARSCSCGLVELERELSR